MQLSKQFKLKVSGEITETAQGAYEIAVNNAIFNGCTSEADQLRMLLENPRKMRFYHAVYPFVLQEERQKQLLKKKVLDTDDDIAEALLHVFCVDNINILKNLLLSNIIPTFDHESISCILPKSFADNRDLIANTLLESAKLTINAAQGRKPTTCNINSIRNEMNAFRKSHPNVFIPDIPVNLAEAWYLQGANLQGPTGVHIDLDSIEKD